MKKEKKFKSLHVLFLLICMVFVFSSCSNNEEDVTNDVKTTDDTEIAVDTEQSSIEIVDDLGRTVILEAPAARIVGTHNPSMNMAIVLSGDGSKIAGFGKKDKAFGLYELIAPEINEVTQIGRGSDINMETVLSVTPDLALIPKRMQGLITQFEDVDIPVIVLDVETYDSIGRALNIVGKATGETERAELITNYLDEKIEQVQATTESAENSPRVLFVSGSNPLEVSVDVMLQNVMINMAGGSTVTSDVEGDYWTEVDIEQIVKWNPEVIYFPAYASYTVEDLLNDPLWANIDAVKNANVYRFPSQLEPWDYPTASSVLGLIWTSHNLHPDLYTYDEMMADVDEFYTLVYGRTFTAEELDILEQ